MHPQMIWTNVETEHQYDERVREAEIAAALAKAQVEESSSTRMLANVLLLGLVVVAGVAAWAFWHMGW